jgi:hypothetical protein
MQVQVLPEAPESVSLRAVKSQQVHLGDHTGVPSMMPNAWSVFRLVLKRYLKSLRRGSMKTRVVVLFVMVLLMVSGCGSDANVASQNLSKAADQFEIMRRVVFYNGITGDYILSIEGLCSLGNFDAAGELSVTCKTGEGEYKKHFLGLSDNVTYFAEQLEAAGVDVYHYRVIFKPEAILPNIDIETSGQE